MKITVSQYAKQLNISTQTVYRHIKKGLLDTIKEGGITYVIAENEAVKQPEKHSDNSAYNDMYKLVKQLRKENKKLVKQLQACSESKETVLLQYIQELKAIAIPETVTVKPKEKKKKKKKKHNSKD